MRTYILRRLLLIVPIMLGVSFFTFLTFRIVPGDIAQLRCGIACTPETVTALRHDMGLDRPWYEQYGDWLGGVIRGDFGRSLGEGRLPVTTELIDHNRLAVTGQLLVMTILFALLLGIPPGVISAIRPGTALDFSLRLVSVVWLSVPSFYLGILLIVFAVAWFGWAPPQFGTGYVSFFDDPWVNLQQFTFPSLILAVGSSAGIMRLVRSSLLEVMRDDYIRTAWAKGLRERTVVWRHALKNALIPATTVIGLQVGALLSGTVVVESIFALNGVGVYILVAIVSRDFLVVQSLTLLFAAVYVFSNLAVDVAYAWLDPRIRYA